MVTLPVGCVMSVPPSLALHPFPAGDPLPVAGVTLVAAHHLCGVLFALMFD
jgi:hypothetical protein